MKSLYGSPIRVYFLIGLFVCLGVISGLKLPVSMFPVGSNPVIWVGIEYGSFSADEFQQLYGNSLEQRLKAIEVGSTKVQKIVVAYESNRASYEVHFEWGSDRDTAIKETETLVNSFANAFPEETRRGVHVGQNDEGANLFGMTFTSTQRTNDELYEALYPIISPLLTQIKDLGEGGLWNPEEKQVLLEIIPEKLAALGLLPRDIEAALRESLLSLPGGRMSNQGQNVLIQMPAKISEYRHIENVSISTPGGKLVHLSDVAQVNYTVNADTTKIIKSNGTPAVALVGRPKPGGNIKKMSEDIARIVDSVRNQIPQDIKYEIVIDPAKFINSAIINVAREVLFGSLLATVVLFLFIGNLKNVITTALEIPISMVLAFILMKLSGMNLNLITLGGLALSAGMNVDASVVVMENIFRHFKEFSRPLNSTERLHLVLDAVAEVKMPIIASTVTSLVVFLPLVFTSGLSFAILGDLAKAVVFSHGFSAIVALILVPTVRLHIMEHESEGAVPHQAPLEFLLHRLEYGYSKALRRFIATPFLKMSVYGILILGTIGLGSYILPSLPKEIVGKPESEYLVIGSYVEASSRKKQMESHIAELEQNFVKEFGGAIASTFTIIDQKNQGIVIVHLKDKSLGEKILTDFEKKFPNTPQSVYFAEQWNPSEFKIPDPPQLKIAVLGGSIENKRVVADALKNLIRDEKNYTRVETTPYSSLQNSIDIQPNLDQWNLLKQKSLRLSHHDILDILRVGTMGRWIKDLAINDKSTGIFLKFPERVFKSITDIKAFPLAVGNSVVPLEALAKVEMRPQTPTLYRDDGRSLFYVTASLGRGDQKNQVNIDNAMEKTRASVAKWLKENGARYPNTAVNFEDASIEITTAIKELVTAVGWSVVLIFIVMILQFGKITESLIVMVAVPLGFLGVILALYLFKSNLSLNSVLGMILLNGIAVANSIILVDFIQKRFDAGLTPIEAVIDASQKRLRPILITTLTTILAMLPIAFGFGEGGKILQPLGVAVCGGLWFSTAFTIFLVPAIQASHLQRIAQRRVGKL